MGRSHHNVEYPRVPAPQPPTEYRATPPPSRTPPDDRFSWVPTPAQERNPDSFHDPRRLSTVPPLPTLPAYIQHDLEKQEQAVRKQSLPQPPQPRPDSLSKPPVQQGAADYRQSHQHANPQEHSFAQCNHYPQSPPRLYFQNTQPLSKPEPVQAMLVQAQHHRPTTLNLQNMPQQFATTPKPLLHIQSAAISIIPVPAPEITFAGTGEKAQPSTGGTWAYSLFSCAEPTVCMTGLFCPCILYGRVQRRLQLRSESRDPTNVLGHNSMNGSCVAWSFLCGINGILSAVQRTRVRRAYNMGPGSGNVFGDCLQGCCCCCCVLAQNEKEIMHRQEGARLVVNQGGYVPPIGMTFAPPPR